MEGRAVAQGGGGGVPRARTVLQPPLHRLRGIEGGRGVPDHWRGGVGVGMSEAQGRDDPTGKALPGA